MPYHRDCPIPFLSAIRTHSIPKAHTLPFPTIPSIDPTVRAPSTLSFVLLQRYAARQPHSIQPSAPPATRMAQENGGAAGSGDGPSAGKMKKVIVKLLENNDYNPGITLGQIRNKLQKKFVDKYPAFDFSSVAFKVHSRALIEDVIHAYEDATRAGTAGGAASSGAAKAAEGKDNKEEEKEKKRTHSDHDDASSAAAASKKAKAEGHAEGSGSKSAEQPPDPRLVRLKKLATAMGLVPAIYKDFGEMDVEAKVKALRERLHEKGAVFDNLPSLDQIKAAEEAYELQKDLEGIDSSNIVVGKRGSAGPSASGSTSTSVPTSSASSPAAEASPSSTSEKKKGGKKEKKSSGGGGEGSSSEEEMDL